MASSTNDSGIGRGSTSEESLDVNPGSNDDTGRRLTPEEREAKELKEFMTGPKKLLTESVQNQNKVLISLRNNKKLIGRVKAFDGYLNMVLEGVKEMWTEVGKDGKSVPRDRFIGKMFLRETTSSLSAGDHLQLPFPSRNKNGVLWSQTRMRIEMRLRCFLVIL